MDYIVLFFGHSGSLQDVVHIVCEDDGIALEAASAMPHSHVLELWQSGRLVHRIEPGAKR